MILVEPMLTLEMRKLIALITPVRWIEIVLAIVNPEIYSMYHSLNLRSLCNTD